MTWRIFDAAADFPHTSECCAHFPWLLGLTMPYGTTPVFCILPVRASKDGTLTGGSSVVQGVLNDKSSALSAVRSPVGAFGS